MQKEQFRLFLLEKGACGEARKFCEGLGMRQAYKSIQRPDWILWLAGQMVGMKGAPSVRTIIEVACDCAETALKFVPEGEDRPRKAIEAARICALDPTEENKQVARDAAYAAYAAYAANAAAAYAAAYAAANAAANAANAAYAAASAANAAYAAANAAAYADAYAYAANAATNAAKEKAQKEMCDLIRKRFNLKWKRIGK